MQHSLLIVPAQRSLGKGKTPNTSVLLRRHFLKGKRSGFSLRNR
jgi:hypothetical protein